MDTTFDFSVLLEDFLDSATGHLDAVENALMDLEKSADGGRPEEVLITRILGNLHTLKGNSGMMGFSALQQFIHKLEDLLKSSTEKMLPLRPNFFEAFFAALNAIREAMVQLSADAAHPLDFSDEQMLLECLAVETAGTCEYSLPEWKRDDQSGMSHRSNTLKVNFEKLDELMNLVGELVIHRTALFSLESRFRDAIEDRGLIDAFNASGQMIAKTANDLREAVMKIRMLPVKSVFYRFNRLVRDLSQRHGKNVRLEFEGEETELDKTVIDEIGEPLLHLIRNAIDHGIESPEERIRHGKPPAGLLKLTASHLSNTIVITVEDDGRGISVDSLKETAVERGLLDSREAHFLSHQEALQLVFLPGFSTRQAVTETSGRGIGLDVVKKTVTSFCGAIELESVLGAGTRFVIKLPLTLAIINALMVEVSGETFAIPLSGVLESIKIGTSEIHEVSAGEIVHLRDRLLPVVRLDRFFALEKPEKREAENIVVVNSGEKLGGLIVDRLIGQQEIVIKGMDDYLGKLPGISGGTVLGNGRISLILDIETLFSNKMYGGFNHGT